jgi:[acyl-carrier-protein] S-malonyltransferase
MAEALAFLLAGQGAQHAGMFDALQGRPEAEPIFAASTALLAGTDPRDLVRKPGADLHQNHRAQILCCTAIAASWAILSPRVRQAHILAGYSIGDLAAWHCTGLFDARTLLQLAAARAEAMDDAGRLSPGGLVAVLGLRRGTIDAVCQEHKAEVAIVNGEDHFVLGCRSDSLAPLVEALKRARAAVVRLLPVSVASHTLLLEPATHAFHQRLAAVTMPEVVPSSVRLLSGLDGESVFKTKPGQAKLAVAISHTIDWAACLDACREAGAITILELGPGHALATMAREAIPRARIRSLDDFRTLDGASAWLNTE